MTESIKALTQAIGYPDEVPVDCRDYTLSVDDFEVRAQVRNNRLLLSASVYTPPRDGSEDGFLAEVTTFVIGRILKEEAVLAWDPDSDSLMIWQEFPVDVGPNDLRRFFEVFTASFEWWRDRVREVRDGARQKMPEFVIRP